MRKLAFTGIILQPSVISFTTVIIISSLVFLSAIFNIGGSNDSIYRLLLGSESSTELIDSTKSFLDSISQVVFDNPIINRVLFFCFWLFVGLLVYIFLTGAGVSIGAAQKIYDDEKLLNAHKQDLQRDLILRVVLRTTALIAWLFYIALFFKLFLPFSMLAFQVSLSGQFSLSNVGIGILGYLVLIVSMHLNVVLLRCVLLRPRTFGGWDDVIAARLT